MHIKPDAPRIGFYKIIKDLAVRIAPAADGFVHRLSAVKRCGGDFGHREAEHHG